MSLITVTVNRKPTRAMCLLRFWGLCGDMIAMIQERLSALSLGNTCRGLNKKSHKHCIGPGCLVLLLHRAATCCRYHVSDTTDVAFLIARLARDLTDLRMLCPRVYKP